MPRLHAIRQIGVTERTFDRLLSIMPRIICRAVRRKKYGGMGTDRLKELKRLRKENERLRKAVPL